MQAHPHFWHPRHGSWIALAAGLAVGAVYLFVASRLAAWTPGWAPLAVVAASGVVISVLRWKGLRRMARALALGLTALLTALVASSASLLVGMLPRGTAQAAPLLFDAGLIWLANMVLFAL